MEGYFSLKACQSQGCVVYKTPTGEVVRVTYVTDRFDNYNYDDVVHVGRVCECIGLETYEKYLLNRTGSLTCEAMPPFESACIQELVSSAQFCPLELVYEVHNGFLYVVRYDPSTFVTTFMNDELETIGVWEGLPRNYDVDCTCYDKHKQPEEIESHRYKWASMSK